ncbi:MAG: protease inhibitor I42 family protein [Bacillota bacterium]|nr:protease inhibitor I42 family protein [Bacillota bacterium]
MKKIISLVIITLIVMTGVISFADDTENIYPVPVLISEKAVPTLYDLNENNFEYEINGNQIKIILNENPSTGYLWEYNISDKMIIELIKNDYISSDSNLIGASGKREYTFKFLKDGNATIMFNYKRSWEENSIENIAISLNNKNNTVNIINDNDNSLESNLNIKVDDNIKMIPLRSTLEEMGYTVKWNGENRTVEINKGAQYTVIAIDKNSYFKNKMAPISLSCAPIIVNDRTLLPIEFFTKILNKGIEIKNSEISFTDEEMAIHTGYVKEITVNENGNKTITIASEMDTNEIMNQIIIHTDENTVFNKNVIKGGFINVISPPIMTMSIPPQTYGIVIY